MTEPLGRLTSFLHELKRRRVYRVAAVYAAVGFVLLETFDLLAGALGLPPIVLTVLVVIALFGFPLALVLAWAFEVRPEGIARTEPIVDAAKGTGGGRSAVGLLATLGILIAGGIGWWLLRSDGGAGVDLSEIRSVAVLPLENLSGDPAEQPFVSGMHEELINQLSRVGALQVTSRTSVMRYGGDSLPNVRQIGRELGVDAVLEGSVLHVGDQVRITLQLIDVGTDTHVWSDAFDREVRDILALHSDVARAVASEVNAALTPEEEQRLTRTRTIDPLAVDHYVRGRALWNARRPDSLALALEEFRAALEIDPTYAEAWAGIADTYVVPDGYELADDPIARAEAAARRALELDGTLAQAHAALAYALLAQWDWDEAELRFLRALELNPSYATGHQWYAELLAAENRMDEAVAAARRANERDPLSGIIAWNLARTLYFARRYDEALARFDQTPDAMQRPFERMMFAPPGEATDAMWSRALEDPRLPRILADSIRTWHDRGVGVHSVADRLLTLATNAPSMLGDSPAAPPRGGADGERPPREPLPPQDVLDQVRLMALAEQGRVDEAFALLDRLLEAGLRYFVVDLVADPALDPIRSDPRYRAVLERIGLAGYWPAEPGTDGG